MGRRTPMIAALMAALTGGFAPGGVGHGAPMRWQKKRGRRASLGGHRPHQGKQEIERRRRQIARGILKVSTW